MRDIHIVKMLEEKAISRMTEAEVVVIESHTTGCADCLRAYRAARVSTALLRARALEAVEPSPFFKTRVMAAIKEKQISPELPAIVRMWKAAGLMVSAMAMIVVILAGIEFFSSDIKTDLPELTAGQSIFSEDYVVFRDDDVAGETLQYDEVLATMYESEDGDGR
jgi:hypothetical protein